jgi:hypothetical protein
MLWDGTGIRMCRSSSPSSPSCRALCLEKERANGETELMFRELEQSSDP